MSLNWKEIALIISEEDISGSKIQAVIQNDFHRLTWELYSQQRGRFSYCTEVGTDQSRLHVMSPGTVLPKTKKLQRFVQFARKNIEGSVITSVSQLPFDRCVIWSLDNHGKKMKIYIRLYSGPGANIIVTDENDVILDLLLRRPGRDEMSGQTLKIEERTSETKIFDVRPYEGNFNEFIEKTCGEVESLDTLASLRAQVEVRKTREIESLNSSIRSVRRTIEENADYESFRKDADLLAASVHMFKKGDSSVELQDWTTGETVSLFLDRSLSPGENVEAYYSKYRRAAGTFKNAETELKALNEKLEECTQRFDRALAPSDDVDADIARLRRMLERTVSPVQEHSGPGLRCTSGGFEILVGRNAKENDELLRHYAKGNDMWMHTRDFPGGYVFIKFRRDKTIPLDVLLDGANLAVLFSKGKNLDKVDLYYTQVRFLRRAKDGKTGLVLPTQEKNLSIKPDRSRIDRLLPEKQQV